MNINLNFKAQFAEPVRSGEKRQTIRPRGQRRAKVGDTLYLFTGMRTKHCERLRNEKCLVAVPIDIDTRTNTLYGNFLTGQPMNTHDMLLIEKLDGFKNSAEFFAFFRKQYGEGIHQMILYRW